MSYSEDIDDIPAFADVDPPVRTVSGLFNRLRITKATKEQRRHEVTDWLIDNVDKRAGVDAMLCRALQRRDRQYHDVWDSDLAVEHGWPSTFAKAVDTKRERDGKVVRC